jgi:hypothetical protein
MASMVLDRPVAELPWAPKLGDGQVYISIAGTDAIQGPYHVPPMTRDDVLQTSLLLADSPPLAPEPDGLKPPTRVDRRRIVPPEMEKAIRAEKDRVLALFREPENTAANVGLIVYGKPPTEKGYNRNAAIRVVEDILRERLAELEAFLAEARAEREQARATTLSVVRTDP